jgi:regulator of RNase E activity RraA
VNIVRIFPAAPRVDEGLIAALRELPSTIVSDQQERNGLALGVLPVTPPSLGILAGQALTVRTQPGDNVTIYKAISIAQPGDVLVVDGGGAMDRALMGEIVYRFAIAKGIIGMVFDGVIRDAAEIAVGPVPVYAKGIAHLGPYKYGPGEIGGTVSVGGLIVRNGDVIVGDADGITAVPVERLERVIETGRAAMAMELEAMRLADEGILDVSWIEDMVKVVHVGVEEAERAVTPDMKYGMR